MILFKTPASLVMLAGVVIVASSLVLNELPLAVAGTLVLAVAGWLRGKQASF